VQQRPRTAAVHGAYSRRRPAHRQSRHSDTNQQHRDLAAPKAAAKTESYSVSVRNIPVQDILFALSRDAKLNVDIHPGIIGVVTLNAIDQTLQQILSRIAKQVDMRWEIDGPNLIVMPDSPFLRSYKVDYVNIARNVTSTVTVSSQISSTGGGGSGGSSSNNNSESKIENKTYNKFWETLEKNIKDILHETDKILPEGSSETVIERSDQQATTGTGAQTGQTAASRAAGSTNSLAGSPNAASLQQQGTTVVKRATFREMVSVIPNHGSRRTDPCPCHRPKQHDKSSGIPRPM
jgi:MSHA biogenesis protein MshL